MLLYPSLQTGVLLDSSTETGVLLDDSISSNGIESTVHHCNKLLSSRLELCEEPSHHVLEPVFAKEMSNISWQPAIRRLVLCHAQLLAMLCTKPGCGVKHQAVKC